MQDPQAAQRLYRNARREMFVILVVTALALVWTVGYCYLFGYQHDEQSWVVRTGLATPRAADNFQQIAGLPDWVLFGIVIPWLVCTVFTIGFCFYMKDDDLGTEAEEGQTHGH
jgi:hypothetical protein